MKRIPMHNKNGFSPVLVLFLAVIASTIAFGAYRMAQPTKQLNQCTLEAKICPDGSSVGRIGPNCEFASCSAKKIDTQLLSCKSDTDCPVGHQCQVQAISQKYCPSNTPECSTPIIGTCQARASISPKPLPKITSKPLASAMPGEACGGFAAPPYTKGCTEGYYCAYPPNVADTGGICIKNGTTRTN